MRPPSLLEFHKAVRDDYPDAKDADIVSMWDDEYAAAYKKSTTTSLADYPVSAAKGAVGVASGLYGVADALSGGALDKSLDRKMSTGFTALEEGLDSFRSEGARNQSADFGAIEGVGDSIGYLWDNPEAFGNIVAESVGYMGGTLGVANAGIKAVSLATRKAALAKGGSAAAAETLAKKAGADYAEAMSISANTGVIGGGSFNEGRDSILNLSDAELKATDGYNELLAHGVEEGDIRNVLAQSTGLTQGAIAAAFSSVASKVTGAGKFEGDVLTGGVKGFAGGAARGFKAEAIQESIESGGESIGRNVGIRSGIDSEHPLFEGTAKDTVIGGLLGGITGGGLGAIGGAVSGRDEAQRQENIAKLSKVMDERKQQADAGAAVAEEQARQNTASAGGDALDTATAVMGASGAYDEQVIAAYETSPLEGELLAPVKEIGTDKPALEVAPLEGELSSPATTPLIEEQKKLAAPEEITEAAPEEITEATPEATPEAMPKVAAEPKDGFGHSSNPRKDRNSDTYVLGEKGDLGVTADGVATSALQTAGNDPKKAKQLIEKSVVEGEFREAALKEVSAQDEARVKIAKKAEAQKKRKAVKPTDSMLTALAKIGGVNLTEAEAQGIDPAERTRKVGIRRVFNNGKNSLSFDAAAEVLSEMGYDVANDEGNYDANVLLDRISSSLSGEDQFTPQGHEAMAAEESQQRGEEIAEREREIVGSDVKGTEATKESVPTDAYEQDGDLLSSYSEEDVQAREAAIKEQEETSKAETKKAVEKTQADKEVDDFQLTGSDLPADANANQSDVFTANRAKLKEHSKPKPIESIMLRNEAGEKINAAKELAAIDTRLNALNDLKLCLSGK